MEWLKDILSSVLDRVKALFTGDWAGDPRVAQALLALGVATAAVAAYSVVKEMWRDGALVLPDGGVQSLLSEFAHYAIGCGIGAAVVTVL